MFRATHIFGPMAGEANDVSFAAPHVPERLSYAPAPQGISPVTPNGYMLVDVDGATGAREHPWPGQIEYVLDRQRSQLKPHPEYEGMETGMAVYELAPDVDAFHADM